MTLYELNTLYLKYGSDKEAITKMNCPESTISIRLMEYKKKKRAKGNQKRLFRKYYKEVWKLTNAQNLNSIPGINNRSFTGYHLDHKVSIKHGFLSGIPAKDIAHISNLRMIPAQENIDKGTKSYIDNNNNKLDSKIRKDLPRV